MAMVKSEALAGRVLANISTTPFRSSRQAFTGIQAIRKALETLEFRGVSPQQIENTRYQMYEALTADLFQTVEAEKAERRERLEKVKQRYDNERKRTRSADRERLEMLTRRYSAMTDQEIETVATEWIGSENETDPAILDSLSAELRTRDSRTWEQFRETMAQRNSYAPHEKTETGKVITAELKQLEQCDGRTIPYVEDGSRGVVSLSDIDSFLGASDENSE